MLLLSFVPIWCVRECVDMDDDHKFERVEMRRVRIVAAGDLMQHRPQMVAAQLRDTTKYDFTPSFTLVADRFIDADISIINLETTLSEDGPYTGYPCFCAPEELADAMADMGIDVAAMANNHCCDKGAKGIKSTLDILDKRDISRVGVYRDSVDYKNNNILYIKRRGMFFAILNYTYGTNGINVPKGMYVNLIDTVAMARDLEQVKAQKVDCVIAVMHWGNEYERNANASQIKIEKFLRRHGVNIIFGSHPHVVQPYREYANGVTLYSMGNFVSNQRTRYRDGGIIATVDVVGVERWQGDSLLKKDVYYELSLMPVWVMLPKYVVVPADMGEQLDMNYDSRFRYNRFMNDLREHIDI